MMQCYDMIVEFVIQHLRLNLDVQLKRLLSKITDTNQMRLGSRLHLTYKIIFQKFLELDRMSSDSKGMKCGEHFLGT